MCAKPSTTRKQVQLLDGLALLLISKKSAQVYATSFVQSGNSIEIYLAKNHPAPPSISEAQYLDNIAASLMSGKDSFELLRLCIIHCWEKILSRIKKASQAVKFGPEDVNILGVDEKHPAVKELG